MQLRSFAFVIALSAGTAAVAGAQSAPTPAVHELAPVTVTAQSHGTLYRVAHIDDQRAYVLGLMDENRRLAADLQRADERLEQLAGRLVEVKADHDRRVAGIAALDSAAAETHRQRLELEEKLRRLAPVAANDLGTTGSR